MQKKKVHRKIAVGDYVIARINRSEIGNYNILLRTKNVTTCIVLESEHAHLLSFTVLSHIHHYSIVWNIISVYSKNTVFDALKHRTA